MGVQARLGNPEVMAMDARMSSDTSHSQLGASLLCPETDSLWTGVGWTPNHRNTEKWRGVRNLSLWVSKLVLLVFPILILASKCVSVVQLCPTLWDSMGCSPSGSSVHGILQARTLEWVTIPFSRGSSRLRVWTQNSCIAGRFFTIWGTREAEGKPRGHWLIWRLPAALLHSVNDPESSAHSLEPSASLLCRLPLLPS